MNQPSPESSAATRTVDTLTVSSRRGPVGQDVVVLVHDSGVAGPTTVVTANLHGDEATGIGVVRRIDRWLQDNAFVGRVVLYPSCNPDGLRAQSRHVPADEIDLNRSFPGDAHGGFTPRLAAALWADIARWDPDQVIDLHADAPVSLPYVIVDRPVRFRSLQRRALADRLESLAHATGLTVLREYPDDVYVQFSLDRSLAGAVVNLMGVPAITIEAGPRRALDPEAVEIAWEATLGALGASGHFAHQPVVHLSCVLGTWRRSATPRTRRGGLVETRVVPGECFVRGDVLAQVFSLAGVCVEDVVATEAGMLVSWVERCWVTPGGLLGTVAVLDREAL